jgi:hypothetical protein
MREKEDVLRRYPGRLRHLRSGTRGAYVRRPDGDDD